MVLIERVIYNLLEGASYVHVDKSVDLSDRKLSHRVWEHLLHSELAFKNQTLQFL